jgi:hypothetical protein
MKKSRRAYPAAMLIFAASLEGNFFTLRRADQAAFLICERGGAVSIVADALAIVLNAVLSKKHLAHLELLGPRLGKQSPSAGGGAGFGPRHLHRCALLC